MLALRTFVALCFLVCPSLLGARDAPLRIVVAPDGDDSAAGTVEAPLATITRARDLVRERRAAGEERPVDVLLREGTWRITEAVVFGVEDSQEDSSRVRYRAWPGEKPVISGGRLIQGWEEGDDGVWSVKIPEVRSGKWLFRELFVNGRRATRARHPNEGTFRVADVGEDRRTSFTFHAGDVKRVDDIAEVELVFFHDWSISRVRVKDVDEGERRLTTRDPVGPASRHFAMDWFEKHPRYRLENSASFLDAPGEWHLDAERGVLRYRPLPGEEIAGVEFVAPVAGTLLVVRGDGEKHVPVRNLSFEGLAFEHCAWLLPPRGYAAGQAGFHERRFGEGGALREPLPAALSFELAESCFFSEGRIAHLGGSGIRFGRECRGCELDRSVVTDISGNGVMIGEDRSRSIEGKPWWQAAPDQATRQVAVRHSLIEHCGRQFFGAVGVWVGLAAETAIYFNDIRYVPYTGVSVGWMWNPSPTPCRQNEVAFNHIHHVMQVLSDGGGIYTLGRQPGTRLVGNVIHDVPLNAGRAESNGMFLDEGTTGIVIAHNVIYNVERSPLRFHRAQTNDVRRNVLVVEGETPRIRYNNTKPEDIREVANVVLKAGEQDEEIAARVGLALTRAGRPPAAAAESEERFRETLTNAVLEGRWCLVEDGRPGEEQADRYTIRSVTKLPVGDTWLINARIEYGEKDFTVPIPVQVKWAGDTPVISVTDIGIPGAGTYTARVVIRENTYAGTWSGGAHQGLVYGTIRKAE